MKRQKLSDQQREQLAGVLAWFSVLLHARATDDFAEADKARKSLESSGVVVRFSPREVCRA